MAIRLVIFDLDGTLIDSSRDLADSVNAMLGDFGVRPLPVEAVTAMVGEGAAVLVRRALLASGLPEDAPGALPAFLDHYSARLTIHTRPYDGIAGVLGALHDARVPLAVLTNKPQAATSEIMRRLELDRWFRWVVGGDTIAGRKPDPAGLLGIAAAAAVGPADTLLIGDSPVDVQTARAAGCRVCVARYGFGWREGIQLRGDETLVDTPAQLLEAIGPLAATDEDRPAPDGRVAHAGTGAVRPRER